MSKSAKVWTVAGAVLAVAVLAGGAWIAADGGSRPKTAGETLRSRKLIAEKRRAVSERRRAARLSRIEAQGIQIGEAGEVSISQEREDAASRLLTEEQKELIRELERVLLMDDKDGTLRQVRRIFGILARKGLNPLVREHLAIKAISSLSWLGADGVPELAMFLADESEVVREVAMNEFEQALLDFTLGDRELAAIVTSACKVLTDRDSLDTMMMYLDMKTRHSVGVEAFIEISRTGTEQALEMLPTEIEFYTGTDAIQTEEDLLTWLDENPDGAEDEKFYGGFKD